MTTTWEGSVNTARANLSW